MMTQRNNAWSDSSREQIAQLAYLIWEQAGRPQGQEVEHWLQAEAQIKAAVKPAKTLSSGTAAPTTPDKPGQKTLPLRKAA